MSQTAKPIVFSYLRWSSPEQRKNTSRKRQEQFAVRYADKHGLELSEAIVDDGVSGYSGKNTEDTSELGKFLLSIQENQPPEGSVLIVESLDRISRQHFETAYETIRKIVKSGVKVVTYSGTDEEIVITEANDFGTMIRMLVELERAHSESSFKSMRVSEAFKKNLEEYKSGIVRTGQEPAWVTRKVDSAGNITGYDVKDGYDEVICKIFHKYVNEGMGTVAVCNWLNKNEVPPFTAKARAWHASYIERLLRSRSLIGEVTFKSMLVDEPFVFQDYYPEIIDKELFEKAQDVRKSRTHSKATSKSIPSFITGIGITYCGYCGFSVATHQAGSAAECKDEEGNLKDWARRLRCRGHASKAAPECLGGSSKVSLLEDAILDFCSDKIHFSKVLNNKLLQTKLVKIEEEIEATIKRVDIIQFEIKNLAKSFRQDVNEEVLREINADADILTVELHEKRNKLKSLTKAKSSIKSFNADDIQCKITDLQTKIHGTEGKSSRLKLRQIILDFVERIDVYRYGIPMEGAQRIEVEKGMLDAGIPEDKITLFIEHHNKNLKSSKTISYKITFKSGVVRIINVDTSHGVSQSTDDETLQFKYNGKVVGYGNPKNRNNRLILTPKEYEDAWKRKW